MFEVTCIYTDLRHSPPSRWKKSFWATPEVVKLIMHSASTQGFWVGETGPFLHSPEPTLGTGLTVEIDDTSRDSNVSSVTGKALFLGSGTGASKVTLMEANWEEQKY